MKFNDYPTVWQATASEFPHIRDDGLKAFYQPLSIHENYVIREQSFAESSWLLGDRPYYNVWQGVVDAFLKLDLAKVPTSSISFPVEVLSLRFAETSRIGEFEFEGEKFWIKSLLISSVDGYDTARGKSLPGFIAHIDVGETGLHNGGGYAGPVCTWRRFPVREGFTVQDSLEASDKAEDTVGIIVPREVVVTAFKIISACGVLEDDASILVPDVLNKDKHKPLTDSLVAKAARRGKVGWDVGKLLGDGVSPHFRVPHPALYHIGPGREKTVIRFRTGKAGGPIIVNPDKITKMPTGYQGKETK